MPIHILPGPTDPSGTILPQQKLPRAMFGSVSSYSTFVCETNPTYLNVSSGSDPSLGKTRTILVNSGQPLDDMFKYLPSPPVTRLAIAESTLKWRHMAPTAPDTLWCHPYFTTDPFVLTETPDIYVIGNQPRFQTRLVTEDEREDVRSVRRLPGQRPKRCRIVLLPEFAKTGTMVLVNLRTLRVKNVRFALGAMRSVEEKP
jgi:DNA polymerase delta subunit 2